MQEHYERVQHSTQLCWRCANAVPDETGMRGCSWSREFRPVPGWTAERVIIKPLQRRSITTYAISACPQFEEG